MPEHGPAPLDEVVKALEALEVEDLPRQLQPFVEVAVLVDGPEPNLQSRVLGALEGKPVRLTRIVRTLATKAVNNSSPFADAELAALQPEAVFAALFAYKYGGSAPPAELAHAFQQLLVETNISVEDA